MLIAATYRMWRIGALLAFVILLADALAVFAGQGITGIKATYETNVSTNENYATTGAVGSGGAFDPATIFNIKFNITIF